MGRTPSQSGCPTEVDGLRHRVSTGRPRLLGSCLVLAGVFLSQPAWGQQPGAWNYRDPNLTRQQLTQLLARYQAATGSSAYSQYLKASIQADADSIAARLANGDIRPGDRMRITVDGQPQLSDTFLVSLGPVVALPVVGSVNLHGVLRSELQDRMSAAIASVYRAAVVRVQLLTRLAVVGGVGRPGFYSLPRNALLDDAITAAGGLAPEGRLDGLYVERGKRRVWASDSLQVAMRQGRTIQDLSLQSGDRIVVPSVLPRDPVRTAQVVATLLAMPLSLYALVRLF